MCEMSVEHWWEDNWLRKTEVLTVGQEPVPLPVCPSQVLHKWHQVWTNVSHSEKAVATRQSCVVAVIRHKYQPKHNSINFYRTAQAHLFYICGRLADNMLRFCHSSMSGFMSDLSQVQNLIVMFMTCSMLWGNKKWFKKVNVYLPSLMMKVPDHLYVLGDTYTCHT
jgi:hypothetical protein